MSHSESEITAVSYEGLQVYPRLACTRLLDRAAPSPPALGVR